MSEAAASSHERLSIREAVEADLEYLPGVEASADSRFSEIGITNLPPPADKSELEKAKAILVAGTPPVGFATIEEIDGLAHLEQLSVRPEQGGRGIGGELLEEACGWAAKQGYGAITLATFRDVSWNAPFYARHGFDVIDELTPGLAALRKHEIDALKLDDLGPRVIMKRPLRD